MWDAGKPGLIGQFAALNEDIRKEDRSKINTLSFHFRKLEKEDQIKHQVAEEQKS